MKINLEKIILAVEPLTRLFEEPLPIKTTFRLKKITQEIDNNLKAYDESRTALLKQYGEEQKDGTYKVDDPKKKVKLEEEHKELLNSEVNLGFEALHVEILGDIKISSKDLILLDWLITE